MKKNKKTFIEFLNSTGVNGQKLYNTNRDQFNIEYETWKLSKEAVNPEPNAQ